MQKIKLERLFYKNNWHKPITKKIYKYSTFDGKKIEIPNCDQKDINRCIDSAKIGKVF